MARLFISHSSRDNVHALAFQNWLAANGWSHDDIFIDLHGIGAGERWRETLRKANAACEAVVLLASPESLASIECQKEIELAAALGKEIITAIIRDLSMDDPHLARFGERQVVDLSAFPRDHVEALPWDGQDHRIGFNLLALAKIKARLLTLGISPGSFPWPPKDRPNAEPYPGLSAFDEQDAGIFFGRDADIAAVLSEMRMVRGRRGPRLIVIDAASGAGKSSFLRAGLWPRLQRNPDFAPLAILRPSQGLITGPDGIGRRMAPFFERHQQPRAPGAIYSPLTGDDERRTAQAFAALMGDAVALATEVRRVANPEVPPPALLIAIDQAEEMLAAEHSAESERFLAMLAAFLKAPPAGIDAYVLLTIWADSVQRLLDRVAALELETPKAIYLPPLSQAAYRDVVLKPAEVYSARVRRLEIEPQLAEALVRDATGADALPLLAFTLARLFGDFGADGRLTHAGYVAMGGTAGSIQRTLGQAMAAAGGVGTAEHLRRLLIPALVTWDPEAADGQGAAKRLPAPEGALFAGPRVELTPLAQALVDVRLLRRDRATLEVAHEALLRMPPISDWLEDDREFLIWRDRTAKARAAYEANARSLLFGRELDIARAWLEARDDAAEVAEAERAFIAASVVAGDQERHREAERERALQIAQLKAARASEQAAELELSHAKAREAEARAREAAARQSAAAARRILAGLVASIVLALAVGVAGWVAYWQWGQAARNAAMAGEYQKLAEEQGQKEREAFNLVEMLFSQDPVGMVRIGYLYETGYPARGLPQDYTKAREWYEKAAAFKYRGAKRALGLLYANGYGVPQDYTKADEWFKKATADNAEAMTGIGQLYANGKEAPRNFAKAREWFERAAAAGDRGALGKLSRYALLVRDYALALDAAKRALKDDRSLLVEACRAHALMLLGDGREALEAYVTHKGKPATIYGDKLWQQMIEEDFAQLREADIIHPQMAEIELALGIGKR